MFLSSVLNNKMHSNQSNQRDAKTAARFCHPCWKRYKDMKMHRIYLLLLCLIVPSVGLAKTCDEFAVRSIHENDGTKHSLYLSMEEMQVTPSWGSTAVEPSVNISVAATKAIDWAMATHTRFDKFEVRDIEFTRYICSTNHKWFYIVNLTPYIDGRSLHALGFFVAVLLDGKIVVPKVE